MGDTSNDGASGFDGPSPFDIFKEPKLELDFPPSKAPPKDNSKPKFQPKVKPRPQARGKTQTASAQPLPAPSTQVKEKCSLPIKVESTVLPKEECSISTKIESIVPSKEESDGKSDVKVADIIMKDVPDIEEKEVDMDVKLKAEMKEEPDIEVKDDPMSPVFSEPREDKVVREIDVFFTPCIDNETKLYLMQYPLRPYWRPYGLEERCQEVRVKPNQSRLEVDLVIDTDGPNYDHNINEHHLKIEKQTLTSSKIPLSTGYALGILRGNKLHLNPVNAAVQLRPLMSYIDQGKKDVNGIGDDEEMTDVDGGNDTAPEARPKLVPLQVELKKETERQEKMRLQSHAYLKKLDEAEPWIPLEPHGIDSPVTGGFRKKMIAAENFQIPFTMSPFDYVNKLVPGRTSTGLNEATVKDDSGNEGLSRSFLDTLPLEQRFKTLLSKGRVQVLQFERLMRLAPVGSTEQEVLEVLQQYAHLVQGCWVAASFLRYNKAICIIRDYILLLFSKNRLVHHEQLQELKVPKEMIREVLVSLAVQRPAAGGWEFQETTDRSFIKSHHTFVKDQMQRWAEHEEGIRAEALSLKVGSKDNLESTEISLQHSSKDVTASVKGLMKPSMNGTAQGTKSVQVVDGSQSAGRGTANADFPGSTMSPETRAALPGSLRELFSKHHVCSLQLICQSLRDMAKAKSSAQNLNQKAVAAAVAAAKGASAPLPELTAVIAEVASNINGVYFLTSLGNPTLDPFRDVVIALLRTKGPGVGLRKVDIVEASKIALKSEVSPGVYLKVMKELCYTKGGAWVLKPGDGRPA
eukprot:Gb_35421 [translate_table: standard]